MLPNDLIISYSSTTLINNKIYIAGGQCDNSMYNRNLYSIDISKDTSRLTINLIKRYKSDFIPFYGVLFPIKKENKFSLVAYSVRYDKSIYEVKERGLYKFEKDKWKIEQDGFDFGEGGTSTLYNDNIWFHGGENINPLTNVYSYNLTTNEMKVHNLINTPEISFHCSVLVQDSIYFIGGINSDDKKQYLNTIYQLNLLTLTWSTIHLLNGEDRVAIHINCHLYKDKIFVYGGTMRPKKDKKSRYEDLAILDLKEMKWKIQELDGDLSILTTYGYNSYLIDNQLIILFGEGYQDEPEEFYFIIDLDSFIIKYSFIASKSNFVGFHIPGLNFYDTENGLNLCADCLVIDKNNNKLKFEPVYIQKYNTYPKFVKYNQH